MLVEILRLALGLAIMALHRPIARYIMVRERAVVMVFRQRGIPLPLLTERTAENLYFGIGVFVCLLQFVRISIFLRLIGTI